jgi:sporulation protein YlmC with PRC-barrel domain
VRADNHGAPQALAHRLLHRAAARADTRARRARRTMRAPFTARSQHCSKERRMTTASGHTSAIRAKKVIGTDVKDGSGQKIGVIEDVVLDKESNNILFAVVGFGGFLGMKEKYHPLPWEKLDYDEDVGAYCVDLTRGELEAAPVGSIEELTRNDGQFRERAYDYYQTPRNW